MIKEEALEILELTDDSDTSRIIRKYHEKYNFYQLLLTNAPNQFLKDLHQINLAKVKSAFELLLPDHELDSSDQQRKIHLTPNSTEAAGGSKTEVIVAWLVLHTEDKDIRSLPVYAGVNTIGRSKTGSKHILIDDDPYVSRIHGYVFFKNEGDVTIYDNGEFSNGTPSKNGIYINGSINRLSATKGYKLNNDDCVQIGNTKFIFRINSKKLADIESDILNMEYEKTVVIAI